MPRQVYLNEDVFTAAKKRMSWIFDEFENIMVSISGGKDSTVMAALALDEAKKRNRRIGMFFLDEEAVYDSTIEEIKYLMFEYAPENVIPKWFQMPFTLTNASSQSESQLMCWEPGKHEYWIHPRHPKSIQRAPWDPAKQTVRIPLKGFGYYDVIENFERVTENTAFLVGLRAEESPNRWGVVTKHPGYKDCHWSSPKGVSSYTFYPLYDWKYSDIWKYIYDNKIRYSKIYDLQWKKGLPLHELRVSSLIHEKAFKSIVDLPEFEPKTYARLMKRIEGIQFAHLYGKDKILMRAQKRPTKYKTWKEFRDQLLNDVQVPEHKEVYIRRFSKHLDNEYIYKQQCKQLLLNDYENNFPVDNSPDPYEIEFEHWKAVL